MSIGLTVGGWFASAFVDTLVEKASSYTLQQLGQRSDLHEEVLRLRLSLRKASAVLRIAERKQQRKKDDEELLRNFLLQLKDAAFDAEDLLADLDYEVLRRKIAEANEASDVILSSFISFATNLFSPGDDDFAAKVRGVRERLDAVSNEMLEVIDILNLEDGGSQHEMLAPKRESTSLPIKPQMIGRDEEKEALIQLLLRTADGSGSSTADRNVSILPVVGMGGMGKTTLTQFVYQDPRVQSYFQLKMWVWVSNEPFDVLRLTREILESDVKNKQSNSTNLTNITKLDPLQVILKEKVTANRYLLVLDDVWNDNDTEWKRLYTPLQYGLSGSMIMVTTRFPKVVEVMTGALQPIFLKGLPEDVYREFFKTCAFGSKDSEYHPEMEEIAERIAAKLKGNPLAAKTVGGLLNSNVDVRHWRNILNSEIWQLQQDENDIMPALRLSYQYLPLHLKRCFSIHSIYPQNYYFRPRELVYFWIAQGFVVEPQANMLLEDMGNRYFLDLTSWSFFQKGWSEGFFEIHDLMHDLAQYVSEDECFRIQNDRLKIPSSIRHLSLIPTKNLELLEVMDKYNNFNKLRSLLIFNYLKPDLNSAIVRWFGRLQYIRMLDLHSCRSITELPKSIGNLKHLQFLNIFLTGISWLPESFCCLYNLRFLNILGCPLKSFPREFTNLINLRRLDADDNLLSKVTNIGKLTNLQYLDYFEVQKKHGHGIDELKNLKELHGSLRLAKLENVESREDACQANLDNKEYIDDLILEWSYENNTCTGSTGFSVNTEVLEGLKPHRDLKELRIKCYRGDKLPSWLQAQTLPCLNSLHLLGCPCITSLPCISLFLKMLVLNNLKLKSLPILWGEGSIDQGIYARGCNSIRSSTLSKLYVLHCQNLTSFEESLLSEHLPSIKIICIVDCKNLVSLPVERFKNFISLEELSIEDCPNLTSSKKLELNPSIKVLKLKSCGELERSLPSCLQNLTSLVRLEICGCLHLECLPWKLLQHMRALENLRIDSCPELRSIEGLDAHTSLEYLYISDCPKLTDFETLPSDHKVQRKDKPVFSLAIDKTDVLRQTFSQSFPCFHLVLRIQSEESVLFDEGDDQEWLQILTSLRTLEFSYCGFLRALPSWLHRLTSLQTLKLYGCPAIESLPENGLPTSLTALEFYQCHPMLTEQLEKHKASLNPLAQKP